MNKIYLSGSLITSISIIGSNIYYGNKLSEYMGDKDFVMDGIVYGMAKSILYSPMSWSFPIYLNHRYRKEDNNNYKPDSSRLFKVYKDFLNKEGVYPKIYDWK